MFVRPTLAETAGLEDENGNPLPGAQPEPEKVTIDMLPAGSVWEREGERQRFVLGAKGGRVRVIMSESDEAHPLPEASEKPVWLAPASFTGWTRVDAGGEAERLKSELEQLRGVASELSISARYANLARTSRGLAENFDVLSARAVGASAPGTAWDTLVDARGLLARLTAEHSMLEELVGAAAAAITSEDFEPVHDAIVATLRESSMVEGELFEQVQVITGPMQPYQLKRALIGLVAIGWLNPPTGGPLSLSDKGRLQ